MKRKDHLKFELTKEDLEDICYIYGKYHTKENRKQYWEVKYGGNSGKHFEADKCGCVKLIKNGFGK